MRMINRGEKGVRLQAEIAEYLQRSGMITHTVKRSKFGSQDIYSCFDTVAIDENGETTYHQVTTVGEIWRHRKKINEKFPVGKFLGMKAYIWGKRRGTKWCKETRLRDEWARCEVDIGC